MAEKTSGELTIETIKQLIRYDIPLLAVGVSSIGKSFTIISLANRFRVMHQMLYIGSEKPENIEGLPKLQHLGDKLEYFKPYWFPNSEKVTAIVTNGRALFLKYIDEYYLDSKGFTYSFEKLNTLLESLSTVSWGQTETKKEISLIDISKSTVNQHKVLNEKPFSVEREILGKQQVEEGASGRDDLRDMSAYICTVLGYGNFWLILDEIDKVEEFDIDKYAPLLHIVRERYLKGWSLVEVNDNKGLNIPNSVKMSKYDVSRDMIDNAIANKQSLLDTRVIAIANKTNNIEDALFKRFVQIVIQDVLILEAEKITAEMANLRTCLTAENIMGGELDVPPMKKLEDVNLQWVFNFFIKMINKNDLEGNFLYREALRALAENKQPRDSVEYKDETMRLMRTTAIWKIIVDNFEDEETRTGVLKCLTSLMFASPDETSIVASAEEDKIVRARNQINQLMDENDSDNELVKSALIINLIDRYPKSSQVANKDEAKSIKIASVNDWVASAYTYLDATIYDYFGGVAPVELNKYLIPAIQHMVIKQITLDAELPSDTKATIMLEAGKWWEKRKDVIKNLKARPEEVVNVLYKDSRPVYGVDYLKENPYENPSLKQKQDASLMLNYANRTVSGLILYLTRSKEEAIIGDTQHFAYLNDYLRTHIVRQIIPAYSNKGGSYKVAADKLNKIFG